MPLCKITRQKGEAIRCMRQAGASYSQISRSVGLTHTAIANFLNNARKLDLPGDTLTVAQILRGIADTLERNSTNQKTHGLSQ